MTTSQYVDIAIIIGAAALLCFALYLVTRTERTPIPDAIRKAFDAE